LSRDKPSAIFKLGGKKSEMTIDNTYQGQLGISIEPIDLVMQQVHENSLQVTLQSDKPDPTLFKVIEHFYNYLSSFSTDNQLIPIKVVHEWYKVAERKLKTGQF
jgi:hypothetical protein